MFVTSEIDVRRNVFVDFHVHIDNSSLNAIPLWQRSILVCIPKYPGHRPKIAQSRRQQVQVIIEFKMLNSDSQ